MGTGLPLLQGLRTLPKGVQNLVGWKVVQQGGQPVVGTVKQVETIHPEGSGPTYNLLRVVQQTVLQPYGFTGQEEHLLPLVPDIVTSLHPQQRLLVVEPPEGLLDLGRRGLLLNFLAQELLPYAPVITGGTPAAAAAAGLAAGARALTQPRQMPSKAALLQAGRSDLVNLIMQVGGFPQAALQLGMRTSHHPWGYWDSLEVLDGELDAFIAGCWVALPCPEEVEEGDDVGQNQQPQQQGQQQEEEVYFYNTATRSIRWELPKVLQQLLASSSLPNAQGAAAGLDGAAAAAAAAGATAGAAAGAAAAAAVPSPAVYQALLELQDERVMPLNSAIREAGRWDLQNAIVRHGGYKAVAAELGRRLCTGLPEELLTLQGLKSALQEVCLQEGWDSSTLPSTQQLRRVDRPDLERAISHLGGWHAAARALRVATKHRHTNWNAWTLADLAQELSLYMAQKGQGQATGDLQQQGGQPAAGAARAAAAAGGSSSSRAAGVQATLRSSDSPTTSSSDAVPRARAEQQHRQGPAASQGCLPLPTQKQLLADGRQDLVYSLRQHGYERVRLYMGLQPRYSRPKRKGVLTWPAVRAAVAAGCHTAKDIMAYISTAEQQQQQQQQQLAGAMLGAGDDTQQTVVSVVSKEHLVRQLKAWVCEGRLVKPARDCYKLPEQ